MISLFRIIKMGFQDFYRNMWLSIVTISIITVTLLLVSLIFVLNVTAKAAQKNIEERMDIAIYFKDPIDVSDKIAYKIYVKNISKNEQNNYTFYYDLSDVLPYLEPLNLDGGQIKEGKLFFKESKIDVGEEKIYNLEFKVLPKNKWPSESILPQLKSLDFPQELEFKVIISNDTKNLDIFSEKDVEKRKVPLWGEIVLLLGDRYSLLIEKMKKELVSIENVKEIKYVSKKEALERFKKETLDPEIIKYASLKNPLSASLEIKTRNPENRSEIESVLEKPEYQAIIKDISWEQKHNREIIAKLNSLMKFLKTTGISISIFFAFVSLLIIINTIKINLFSRQKSIEIMKLVGASPWFIKGPFLVEALIYGLVASFVSFILTYPLLIYVIIPRLDVYIGSTDFSLMSYFKESLLSMVLMQTLIGIILSVFASFVSLNRYFKRY